MTKTPDSFIKTTDGVATSFVGPDAIRLYQAAALKASLNLYAKTGMTMTRGATLTRMLAVAADIQGRKPYRGRTRDTAKKAADDLQVWIDAMKAALPVVEG